MRKTIIIAGSAGTGINTVQSHLEILLKLSGYHLLSYRNYMSRIRGGFNYTIVTAGDVPVYAAEGRADVVLALDALAVKNSGSLLKNDGLLVAFSKDLDGFEQINETLSMDYQELSKKIKNPSAFSMAPLGAALGYMGIHGDALSQIASSKWSEQAVQENRTATAWGHGQTAPRCQCPDASEERILLNGNQAVALGALAAGLGFYSAYPMAPSTGILNTLGANEKKMQIIVEQAEDEIAALIAAIGASSTGVRAMTGTSGGGFSLMVEGLGFAAISETPIVIANVQRPGPATGLPTRTEQGDLSFVVHASQGEFPRMVMAPASVEACFYDTFRAFNLADQFQIPVIILSDQQLGDASQTTAPINLEGLTIHRGLSLAPELDYKRYDYSRIEGGRKYPGMDDSLVMTDSHIHDEYGFMTEDPEAVVLLKKKFIHRMEALRKAVNPPELEGPVNAENLLVCWGSTYGVVKEALPILAAKGHSVAMLHYTDVYPLNPQHIAPWLATRRIINIELNAFNQFGKLLRMETGFNFTHSINRYDGRPFLLEDIITEFEVICHE